MFKLSPNLMDAPMRVGYFTAHVFLLEDHAQAVQYRFARGHIRPPGVWPGSDPPIHTLKRGMLTSPTDKEQAAVITKPVSLQ